jgi:arylsulfatase A-like enzyme
MPTILDLCGIKPIDDLQGKNLIPAIEDNTKKVHTIVYSEHCFFTRNKDIRAYAAISEEYKIIYIYNEGRQEYFLYNLSHDLKEQNNLKIEQPEKFYLMLNELDNFFYLTSKTKAKPKTVTLEP